MGRRLRTAFLLGIVVGLVVAVVRALRSDRPPAVGAGPAPLPSPALRPARTDESEVERRPTAAEADTSTDAGTAAMDAAGDEVAGPDTAREVAGQAGEAGATTDTADEVADEVVAPVTADPLPDVTPPVTAPAAATPPTATEAWVSPVEGSCPDGYPVKAKVASRIFHVPDGAFYGRTVPDRCYSTAAAAEADGFRPSKR